MKKGMREKVQTIKIRPLTERSFRPYGEIVGYTGRPPTFRGATATQDTIVQGWRMDFDVDGTTELLLTRFEYQPWEFHQMERHLNVTQSFFPLGGKPSIMVVAPPTDPRDPEAIPPPEAIRAFFMDGTQGVLLRKGTWHTLHRFPVYPPAIDLVALTCLETTEEIEKVLKAGRGQLSAKITQRADYKERFGVTFKLIW